jgi:hypothetical protein
MSNYMSDYDRSIHNNPDAQAWAKFFMATVKEQGWCVDHIDEELMTGWFANAMMAMHDHVKREWVGLTSDDVISLCKQFLQPRHSDLEVIYFARAIEAKLKEKNAYGWQSVENPTEYLDDLRGGADLCGND